MKGRVFSLVAFFVLLMTEAFAGNGDLIVDGNLGVGTSTPISKMHLFPNSGGLNLKMYYYSSVGTTWSDWSTIIGNNVMASEAPGISRMESSVTHPAYGGAAIKLNGYTGIEFHTKSGEAVAGQPFYSPRMAITSGGNVGIGTTTPAAQLEIAGDGGRKVKITGKSAGLIQIEGDGVAYATSIKFTSGGANNTDLTGIWSHGVGTTPVFLAIGGTAYDNATMYLRNGGVGIGTTDPGSYKLYVAGSTYLTGGWQGSDARFKKDLLDIESPIQKVLGLTGLSYKWKTEEYKEKGFPEGRHYGVIAQEIEKVLPEVVNTAPDGSKAVAYTEIIPVLIEAIKEQQKMIEMQRAEIYEIKLLLQKTIN